MYVVSTQYYDYNILCWISSAFNRIQLIHSLCADHFCGVQTEFQSRYEVLNSTHNEKFKPRGHLA